MGKSTYKGKYEGQYEGGGKAMGKSTYKGKQSVDTYMSKGKYKGRYNSAHTVPGEDRRGATGALPAGDGHPDRGGAGTRWTPILRLRG